MTQNEIFGLRFNVIKKHFPMFSDFIFFHKQNKNWHLLDFVDPKPYVRLFTSIDMKPQKNLCNKKFVKGQIIAKCLQFLPKNEQKHVA